MLGRSIGRLTTLSTAWIACGALWIGCGGAFAGGVPLAQPGDVEFVAEATVFRDTLVVRVQAINATRYPVRLEHGACPLTVRVVDPEGDALPPPPPRACISILLTPTLPPGRTRTVTTERIPLADLGAPPGGEPYIVSASLQLYDPLGRLDIGLGAFRDGVWHSAR